MVFNIVPQYKMYVKPLLYKMKAIGMSTETLKNLDKKTNTAFITPMD